MMWHLEALALLNGELVTVVGQPGVLLGFKELVMSEVIELDVGSVELGIDMT